MSGALPAVPAASTGLRRAVRAAAGMAVIAIALMAGLVAAETATADDRQPGSAYVAAETQTLEADPTQNPGMLWVAEGEALWSAPAGPEAASCATCHGAAARSMAGVAARYPAFDGTTETVLTLSERIAECRSQRQHAPPPARESLEALALAAFVARQSDGMPIATGDDPRLGPTIETGRRLFETRMGQLSLSCADCHDRNAGRRLAGATIPQGHPDGYPIYRLEWQGLGSLQRRIGSCLTGMRAEPLSPTSPDAAALELYLMTRARGMTLRVPGVRP